MAPRAPRAPKQNKNLLINPYNPPEAVVLAAGIHLNPEDIKINPNNWIARIDSAQDSASIIGRLNHFFEFGPLSGALSLNPEKLYHSYLCEFWYTAHVLPGDHTIAFTLKRGAMNCTITSSVIREALELNYLVENELPVAPIPGTNYRAVLQQMGHVECTNEDGTLKTKGSIFMKHLSPSWRYFFIHLVECLGGGSGGLDQINSTQLEMAYCLWFGIRTDFAELIFRSLVEKLKVNRRKEFIPYTRFLSLCFRYILGEAYHYETIHFSPPEYIRDLSSFVSVPGETEIPGSMITGFPLKTGATTPVEPERRLRGPQINEGPIRSSTGVLRVTQPRSSSSQPPRVSLPFTPSEGLQTGPSDPETGLVPRRRLRLPGRATGSSTQASPSGVSQQIPEESQRENPQAASLNVLVGFPFDFLLESVGRL